MTLNEAKALRVGDMIRYRDWENNWETIEIVIEKWHKKTKEGEMIFPLESASLQTVAVIKEGDDDEEYRAKVGDEGWVNEYNHDCFEKIA
jgi:hypothetical protein